MMARSAEFRGKKVRHGAHFGFPFALEQAVAEYDCIYKSAVACSRMLFMYLCLSDGPVDGFLRVLSMLNISSTTLASQVVTMSPWSTLWYSFSVNSSF